MPLQDEKYDILKYRVFEQQVLDHGFVRLVDMMPRRVPNGRTADSAIVQAARVAYGDGTKHIREDRSLIRYLLRKHHTSPFEQVEFKWHCKMPIFVARQWVRHRTASLNEYSGRYSLMPAEFYRPDHVRLQDVVNKQGSTEVDDEGLLKKFHEFLAASEAIHGEYESLAEEGLAREMARIGLPLSMYTEWYWKMDLHNMMHFLNLRMDEHAQWEIRQYALQMYEILKELVPSTIEAFEDYIRQAVTFTGPEIRALREGGPTPCKAWIDHLSNREVDELKAKLEVFPLSG